MDMEMEADPYVVLGIARDATLEDIRKAFRKAALGLHPDNYPGGPVEGERKFRELITAYRTALESFGREALQYGKADVEQAFTPQNLALLDFGWFFATPAEDEPAGENGKKALKDRPGMWKVVFATKDEPAIFVFFWAVGLVLGLVVIYFLAKYRLKGLYRNELSIGDVALLAGASLGVYAATVAGTLFLLVLTRRIFWLAMNFRARKMLTKAHADASEASPQDLLRQNSQLPPQVGSVLSSDRDGRPSGP